MDSRLNRRDTTNVRHGVKIRCSISVKPRERTRGIVHRRILRNRAFSGCCNDFDRTFGTHLAGWHSLGGRINIMCRGPGPFQESSHTPDGGSADDKAFSRPCKDKEPLLRITWPEGIRTKWDADRDVAADFEISFCYATSFFLEKGKGKKKGCYRIAIHRENNWLYRSRRLFRYGGVGSS